MFGRGDVLFACSIEVGRLDILAPTTTPYDNNNHNNHKNTTKDRDVEAGTITMSVAFAGVPIYEGTDDLCAKTTCPIRPGPVVIDYRQDLPPVAPPVSEFVE